MSGSGGTNILQELFVRIGWQVDTASQKKGEAALSKMAKDAVSAWAAIEEAAVGVAAAVTKVAQTFEQLYFVAERAGSSVQALNALEYSLRNVGGSAGGALSAVESLGRFIRNTPAAGQFLAGIGVQLRDAQGNIRDTADLLIDLGRQFSRVQPYRAQAYANILGIDYNTLIALQHELGEFREQYLGLLKSANLNQNQAAKSSHEYMMSLRLLGATFGVLMDKVLVMLQGPLLRGMRQFQAIIVANFDPISKAIEKVARWVFFFADTSFQLIRAGIALLQDVVGWFNSLTPSARRAIEALAAIAVAWRLLNTAFLTSPLGIVLALAAGLLLLYDDYEGYKKGFASAIDWGPLESSLNEMRKAFTDFANAFGPLGAAWVQFIKDFGGQELDTKNLFSLKAILGDLTTVINTYAAAVKVLTEALNLLHAAMNVPQVPSSTLERHGMRTQPGGLVLPGGVPRGMAEMGTRSTSSMPAFSVWNYAGKVIEDWIKKHDQEWAVGRPLYQLQRDLGDGAKNMFQRISTGGGNWFDRAAGAADQIGGGSASGLAQLAGGGSSAPSYSSGPVSGMGGGEVPASAQGRIKQALDFFMGRGWSAAQAAGIVANLWAESHLDPNAFNPAGGGLGAAGIAQWRANRILAIESRFGKPIRSMSLAEQLAAVQWELEGSESRAGAALRGQQSAGGAGSAFQQFYERGGPQYVAPRGRAAEGLFRQQFGGGGAPGGGGGDSHYSMKQETHIHILGDVTPAVVDRLKATQNRVQADQWRNFKTVLI